MRSRPIPTIALLTALGAVLTGCAGEEGTVTTVEQGGLIAVVRTASADGGMDAQISGELISGPGGCLSLQMEGSQPQVIIWPQGTELVTDERPGVDAPGVGTVALGEQLEHSGGHVDNDTYPLPEPCRIDDDNAEVVVLND